MSRTVKICCPALIFAVAAIWLAACAPQQTETPANFEVISMSVKPSQVLTGEEVTVTAQVTNTGSMPGNFSGPLIINGKQIQGNPVTIQPGATRTVTFTFTLNDAGKYSVNLVDSSSPLTVSAVAEKEIELKYDNGTSKDALWAGNNGGFLIDFTAPDKGFTLDKIRICGGLYGTAWEGKLFELSILGSNMKSVLYNVSYYAAKFPVEGAFPYRPPEWVDFDVPPIDLTGKFFIYLYTNMSMHHGVQIGVDDSIENEHSDLAQGKPPYLSIISMENFYPNSVWYTDRSKVNWMIRVDGTTLAPVQ
ncbi:MAG: CARDB domain-containing protein [Dehalococcoidia bacterium]